MIMAELALGALGVVPLIGFTIKSYQALAVKAKTFRHCSSNVLRLYKKLRVQRRIFENECQLLLRECREDEVDVEGMLANPGHEGWLDHEVQSNNVRQSLKRNYDELIDLVRDIAEALRQLEESLGCFEAVKSSQQAVSPTELPIAGGVSDLKTSRGSVLRRHGSVLEMV